MASAVPPTTQIGMPLDEFIQRGEEGPFELIDGEIVPKMPPVFGHGHYVNQFAFAINLFAIPNGLGEAFVEVTFVRPQDYDENKNWVKGSRIPDVLFVQAERLQAYRAAHPDWREKPLLLIPDLAVEVVSPNDSYSEIDEKVERYLNDGVKMVIVLDPQRRNARVYRAGSTQDTKLTGDAVLEGGDILPGFQIALRALFGSAD